MHNTPHSEETKEKLRIAKTGVPLLAARRKPKYMDGLETWLCPTCEKWKPREEYYKKPKIWNGISSQCKKCYTKGNIKTRTYITTLDASRLYNRRARAKNLEKFRRREREASGKYRNTVKSAARSALNYAVKSGNLIKPKSCQKCGEEKKITGHHEDYSKPLDVKWLCYECHGEVHRKKRVIA